ncbi:hypothetical protein [Ureibacillus sinduriensis]|uniref:Uncharacterized protein n=1 Tax=Ureibacillus sinduriensis BLB-1 = JCM 15800 TaxID=1384057 RepID=A0A0A3INE0_9BACL|nr:hypothetical protein [Ureibacillus sinduriensis]KGR76347.1 hypothetical protein CD33_07330 [Ureibacillus sinduriensis BLB-1 = JCM 15800]
MAIAKMVRTFFYFLTIPVLFVLYLGLILSAFLISIAGILRTIGFEQIKMSIWHNVAIPVSLSIPISLIVSFLLIIGSFYIKRLIKHCVSHLNF